MCLPALGKPSLSSLPVEVRVLSEYQKDGFFPRLAGEWLAGLFAALVIGSVFEKIQKLKKSFGPHVLLFLHRFLVSGKVLGLVCFFSRNACREQCAGNALAFIQFVSGFKKNEYVKNTLFSSFGT